MWQLSGFVQGDSSVGDAMEKLKTHLHFVPLAFADFSQEQLVIPRQPGKWSKQQILGHLIDSAINNLKRFTDIQFLPQPYTTQSYKQDELVVANNYNALPLQHLLQLWESLNRQIVYVVQNIPETKLCWQVNPGYDDGATRSLEWIIADYVAHMEHHLRQIFEKP